MNNNQIVTLESSGTITFTTQYKLIWYKRASEIFNENDSVKSYKIELYFDNGKCIKDYVVLPREISNVDLHIKENIDILMSLWLQRCNNVKNCMKKITVVKITK